MNDDITQKDDPITAATPGAKQGKPGSALEVLLAFFKLGEVRRQQRLMSVIGFLSPGSPGPGGPRETGTKRHDRIPLNARSAADLVDRKVDLILAITDPTARTAKNASSTIPVVFFIAGAPVADGLVASLARPGRQPDRRHAFRRRTESQAAGAAVRAGFYADEMDR